MFFERKKNNDFLSINIENLIDWNEPNGEGCIVSDRITKEGFKVGYMYREAPDEDNPDSGWRFLAGNEDEAYMNESSNHSVFSINTICNYDRDIIPYIHAEIGRVYIRTGSNTFEIDDGSKPIFVDKQKRELPVCRTDKNPLGTKGRTSILSVEGSASCGASFPVGRRKLLDRECFVTSFRQGGYTPLRRLCVYSLWTCRLQTA